MPLEEGEIRVTGLQYGSVMDAVESDHKPVFAMLRINMPVTDQARLQRRAWSHLVCAAFMILCAAYRCSPWQALLPHCSSCHVPCVSAVNGSIRRRKKHRRVHGVAGQGFRVYELNHQP